MATKDLSYKMYFYVCLLAKAQNKQTSFIFTAGKSFLEHFSFRIASQLELFLL